MAIESFEDIKPAGTATIEPFEQIGLSPSIDETPQQAGERAAAGFDIATQNNLSVDEGMQLVAGPEPSAFGKYLNKIKDYIAEKTPFLQPDIGYISPRKERMEAPLKTLAQVGAYQAAGGVSGVTLNALDVLANKTVGDKTLADMVARLTGFEPSDIDVSARKSGQYVSSFGVVGVGVSAGVGKIVASTVLKTLLESGLTFGTTEAANQFALNATTGKPVDWNEIHHQSGVGVLFGTGEVSVAAAISGVAKGMERFWGQKGIELADKIRQPGTSLEDQVSRQEAEVKSDIDAYKESFKNPTPENMAKREQIRKKYIGEIPEGSALAPKPAEKAPTSPQEGQATGGVAETAPAGETSYKPKQGGFVDVSGATEAAGKGIAYIKDSQRVANISGDMAFDLEKLKTSARADEIRAMRLIKDAGLSPQDEEAIYHYSDAIDVYGEPHGETLTPEQMAAYNTYVKPLQDASNQLFEAIKNEGVPLENSLLTRRYVAGKGNVLDRIKNAVEKGKDKVRSIREGGLLSKTSGQMKHRVMKSLTDEEGNRVVVSVKGGDVVKYENGQSEKLGSLPLDSQESLRERELKPISDKYDKLEKELEILKSSQGREKASPVRIKNIQHKMELLGMEHQQVMDKYPDAELKDKVFVDNTGKKWTLGEATTKEIEANSGLKYHKTALLNTIQSYNKLNQIKRATDLLESWKSSPDFNTIAMPSNTIDIPDGWKPTQLQQFRGYVFDPKVADTLDHFYSRMKSGGDALLGLHAVNMILRNAIFFNPLIHIPNIGIHWMVSRGTVRWGAPKSWLRLMKTTARAFDAVRTMNDDYLEMLDSGVNLLYSNQTGESLSSTMFKKMQEELNASPTAMQEFKKLLGYSPANLLYKFSGQVTWFTNDLATMQRIYEIMDENPGMSIEDAGREIAKHIPDYRVPARVLNSRIFSAIMTNSNISMFGAYHYGALKSYGEIAKESIGGDTKEKLEALDKMLAIGILMAVVYPAADEVAKKLTGDENAHFKRAGATTFIENTIKLYKGEIDIWQWTQAVVTPAGGTKLLMEFLTKRDWFTWEKFVFQETAAEDIRNHVLQSISPVQQIGQVTGDKKTTEQALEGLAGISTSKPYQESFRKHKQELRSHYRHMPIWWIDSQDETEEQPGEQK